MNTRKISNQVNWIALTTITAISLVFWFFIPAPEGLGLAAWHTTILFIACIVSIVANVLPIGAIVILGITLYAVTDAGNTGTPAIALSTALSELDSALIWLIVCAFLIARGFIKTGLGKRVALLMISFLGKKSLGLAYGLSLADTILAPGMPSNTARCGGVIYPIAHSLAESYASYPNDKSSKKLGSFLITCIGNVNDITSTLFLTAFTGNLLSVSLAKQMGIEISWGTWFLAAFMPCLIALLIIPLWIYIINPPEIKNTPEAPLFAKKQLKEMGKMGYGEWIMLITIVTLLVMWIFGNRLGIHSTVAAMIGLCFLLLSSVLTWEDVKAEKGA